jgi:hypothetical protein
VTELTVYGLTLTGSIAWKEAPPPLTVFVCRRLKQQSAAFLVNFLFSKKQKQPLETLIIIDEDQKTVENIGKTLNANSHILGENMKELMLFGSPLNDMAHIVARCPNVSDLGMDIDVFKSCLPHLPSTIQFLKLNDFLLKSSGENPSIAHARGEWKRFGNDLEPMLERKKAGEFPKFTHVQLLAYHGENFCDMTDVVCASDTFSLFDGLQFRMRMKYQMFLCGDTDAAWPWLEENRFYSIFGF